MLGLAEKVRARGLRGIHGLWRVAEPYLHTDLSTQDAVYYGSFGFETPLSAVRGFSLKPPMTTRHVTEDGKHVLLLEREAFDRALERLFEEPLPTLRERRRCPAPDAALRGAARHRSGVE